MEKKILVVGASSGIGAEIAKLHLNRGNKVALLARRKSELEARVGETSKVSKAILFPFDIADISKTSTVFSEIISKLGGLDEIYFAAGIMEKIGIEEFNTEKDLRMLNINLNACVAWLNLAAEFFSKQGSGKIIGISSIAGERGRVGNPVYNTSKAGMNTYLEALKNRLSKKGIQVLTVKPGFIDTAMTKGMPGLFWLISAEKAAEIIVNATDSGKEHIFVPARWALVALVIRNIPSFIFKKLKV
ncbi:MAG: SDR family NAD(P)-dependent oxidoreductase [Leptospiraceae bacterium]|nr:SDR family NAD(P)-dependent oxidoreductase [Leptospiraceae bacterium]